MIKLKEERRKKLIQEIQEFFEQERDEEIGILAAELVLDFFLDRLGNSIYNQSLDDAMFFMKQKLQDVEFDYDSLYQ